jgi:aspartate aminotransferase
MMNFRSTASKLLIKQNILSKNFSMWGHLKPRPADPILGIVEEFKKDTNAIKVNLSAGTYKDNEGKPYILNCVREAQNVILKKNLDHEYLPIEGLKGFNQNSMKLAYTENNKAFQENRIVACQALSGTGALRIGMEFLKEHYQGPQKVMVPNPSWPNHKNIVHRANLNYGEYRYYDFDKKGLNLQGMLEDLSNAERGTIVVLHACAHNPTGMDPTRSEWDRILKVVQERELLPFFDMAYQGYASGDLDTDTYSVRKFADTGMNMCLSQSFSKNFGLYGQRIGLFSLVTGSVQEATAAESHIKFIARAQYSNPPKYGAQLVDIVLSNPDLTTEWHRELKVMANRINDMRHALFENIIKSGSKLNWDHIVKQIGMFAYTGVNLDQVKRLKTEFHIYLTNDGRISISGLNTSNVEYVAKAFHEVTK